MNTNQPNSSSQSKAEEQQSLNVRELFEFFLRLRYWMIGSAVCCLIFAFLYVRMQTPMFQRQAWIMLNSNDGTNTELALMAEITGTSKSRKIDNEVFILKSPSLMAKVVEELRLNTRYFQYRMPIGDSKITFGRSLFAHKQHEFYGNNPFEMTLTPDSLYPEELLPFAFSVKLRHNAKTNTYDILRLYVNGEKQKAPKAKHIAYGEQLSFEGFSFVINQVLPEDMIHNSAYMCTWSTPAIAAKGFVKDLSAEVETTIKSAKTSDVLSLAYVDSNPRRAEDILNTLILMANQEARDYKNRATLATIQFIDQRIEAINVELGKAETNYKQYQTNNAVVDLASQSHAAITTDVQYRGQLTDVQLQLRILDMVSGLIQEQKEGEYQVIPTNIGVSDAGLNQIISNYDALVSERNRLVANSSASNPRVISLNTQLEDGKKAIELSIANLVRVYNIREKELEKTLWTSRRQMAAIPQQQFEVQQLGRQIDIIEPLYLMLQQKREEAQISMYSQTDNFRIIEAAFGSPRPVSPNAMRTYMMALLLGLLLPAGLVWLRMTLRTKVETKRDITDKLDATVLAVIPKMKNATQPLIGENGRDVTSESFRMLRSNLQYLQGKKVIQVTSSSPGEGKSYVAANLAISISHTGKKVLLMGMDLRKPVLPKMFPNVAFSTQNSIVAYMIGKCTNPLDLVYPSGVSPTLDVAMSGAIPPNPTELLAQGKEGELINFFRDKYDYIIIDSAPFLPVSDSFLINEFVDATLYVIRAGVTDLKMLPEIADAFKSEAKPIKNVSVLLNGVDLDDKRYRYGYGAGYGYGYSNGHGYGYGYGYGFGYGYDEKAQTSSHSRFSRKHPKK